MYKNIGETLKVIAILILIIGLVVSFVLGTQLAYDGDSALSGLGFLFGMNIDLAEVSGVVVMLVGGVMSLLYSLIFYGFGELIEKTVQIEGHLREQRGDSKSSAPETAAPAENAEPSSAPAAPQPDAQPARRTTQKAASAIERIVNSGIQSELEPQSAPAPAVPQDADNVTCGNCGAKLPAGVRFCPRCNARLEPPAAKPASAAGGVRFNFNRTEHAPDTKVLCSSCGAELTPNSRFCTVCGAALPEDVVQRLQRS